MKTSIARLAAALGLALALTACAEDDPEEIQGQESELPTQTGACEYRPDGSAAGVDFPDPDPQWSGDVDVILHTNAGDIGLTIHADDAPCTANAILSLIEQGFYDDNLCHRLTTSPTLSVLQCGSPTPDGRGGPGYRMDEELTGAEQYVAGTLAMAKTPNPSTTGSQFFLVYQDAQLPPEYTILGSIDEDGVAVLRQIAARGTATGASDGPPAADVIIESVSVGS